MNHPERIACMIAALAALGSLLGFPWSAARKPTRELSKSETGSEARPERSDSSPLDGAGLLAIQRPSTWREPSLDADGAPAGDLFTAPPMEYDPETDRLRIRFVDADSASADVVFGFSLIGIVHEPFRLQLVGYAADPTGLIGVFENRITRQVFIARAPKELPELELWIESLAIERQHEEMPGSGTVAGRAAVARVLDRRDGTAIALSSATRRTVGRPSARLRHVERGVTYDVGRGGEFVVDGITYSVAALDEHRVQLCRIEAGAPAERRWLHVIAADGPP